MSRVAVIGGGSAGCLAAAYLSKDFPQHDLCHIYDPRLPVIGVGEGTLPDFPEFLSHLSGYSIPELEERLGATRKGAVRFEGWGATSVFQNSFYPRGESFGFHLSADRLSEVLREVIVAETIQERVTSVHNEDHRAVVHFQDRAPLECDLVVDARGFPKQLNGDDHQALEIITTNSALIRRGPPVDFREATRSVARPYGWIFVIPLQHRTSYGYIYDARLSSRTDIEADFDEFLEADKVEEWTAQAALSFPNYFQKTIYDGRVLRLGNAAAFAEPLEATALGYVQRQLAVGLKLALSRSERTRLEDSKAIDRHLRQWMAKTAVFLAWHYSAGSVYDTPFWRNARLAWLSHRDWCRKSPAGQVAVRDFDEFYQIPQPALPTPTSHPTYAGFIRQNFREIRTGLEGNLPLPVPV